MANSENLELMLQPWSVSVSDVRAILSQLVYVAKQRKPATPENVAAYQKRFRTPSPEKVQAIVNYLDAATAVGLACVDNGVYRLTDKGTDFVGLTGSWSLPDVGAKRKRVSKSYCKTLNDTRIAVGTRPKMPGH